MGASISLALQSSLPRMKDLSKEKFKSSVEYHGIGPKLKISIQKEFKKLQFSNLFIV
jgi:hypothetical protein